MTIDGNKVTRNVAYYIIGHASKFVKPGAVRMGSTLPEGFPNVVFRNPDGSRVAIVLNDASSPRTFNLRYAGRKWVISLPAGGVGTLVW